MPAAAPDPPERLDSWKAIAEYLHRDVGTVRRWEKTLGLPVRRLSEGRGHSVFAFRAEIDEWLATRLPSPASPPGPAPAGAAPDPSATPVVAGGRWRASRVRLAAATIALIAVAVAARWAWMRAAPLDPASLRVEASSEGVVAFDQTGSRRWSFLFPPEYKTGLTDGGEPARVVADPAPGVLVATDHRTRRLDGTGEGGELTWLGLDGRVRRVFSFDDRTPLGGTSYGPPWVMTSYAVDDAGGARRIAVAAHHYTWYPSLVTILDDQWRRRGTFVHAGWVDWTRWLAANRLLIAGYSQTGSGGMVALLDPASLDGQGPETPGSPHYCNGCGEARPLRLIVMPRTELNIATASPFNRTTIEVLSDRIIAHTIEMPATGHEAVDAVYEFTHQLDLRSARFGGRYWEIHDSLERQGKLTHTREQCPDRDGPREIRVWEPPSGWRSVAVRHRVS